MNTIQLALALVTSYKWEFHEMDVKSTFFHWEFQEEKYMEQTPIYVQNYFNHVCLCKKYLYGLKKDLEGWIC